MRRTVAAALVTLALLSACGGGRQDSAGTHSANDAGKASDDDAVLKNGKGGKHTTAPGDADNDTSSGQAEPLMADPNPIDKPAGFDQFPPDWLAGKPSSVNRDDPRLMNCTLERGSICKLHITGWYKLGNFPSGSITAAVFEDDNPEPAQETTSGIPVPKGASRWYIDLPYRVSATAKQISVQAVLRGPSGEVLFEGDRHTYRIP